MIFKRALQKELIFYTLAVYAALLLTSVTFTLIRLLSRASLGVIDPATVFVLLAYSLINLQGLIIGLSVFLGTLLAFGRLWREHEMVVWQASGLSLRRFVAPTFRFALTLALFSAVMTMIVAPWANRQANTYRETFEKRDDLSRLATGRFRENTSGTRVFYVTKLDETTQQASQLFIINRKPATATQPAMESVVVSESGNIATAPSGDRFLTLTQGRQYNINQYNAAAPVAASIDPTWMLFAEYQVLIAEKPEAAAQSLAPRLRDTWSLAFDSQNDAKAEMLWRIAGPLMCVVLALLAIPLSFFSPRTGRSSPILISLVLFIIYFNVLTTAQNGVLSGKFKALPATYVPHLAALCLAVILLLWRGQQLLRLTIGIRRALFALTRRGSTSQAKVGARHA